MTQCWLFYGDAWGFADFARRREEDALKSLRYAVNVVKKLRSSHPDVEYFVFSDTIVCLCEVAEKTPQSIDAAFANILLAVQFLITELVEVGLLLRGVVTFGNLTREDDDEVIIGDALLDAAEFERRAVSPPLVFLPASTLIRARDLGKCSPNLWKNNLSRSIFVPTKDGGLIKAQPLLGDRPDRLKKLLERALHRVTVCERPSPREAAALKLALDTVDAVVNNGRHSE